MKLYNLYYNNKKINTKMLTYDEIEKIKSKPHVTKLLSDTESIKIPTSKVRIIECYIV